ncbi:MAG: NAD-dependent epimerase/dehydratase family protein [Roseibacillus sp.]
MKIFVTGATGFIGSHFLNQAHKAGHELVALRRSENSVPKVAVPEEVVWLTKEMDKLTASDFESIDVLVHLASPGVSPQRASLDELFYWNVSILGSILLAATEANVRRFVVAGTFAEYGRSADRFDPIPPDAPLLPTYDYAASKAAAFQLAHALAISRDFELVYLRIFSAFGEGQHPQNFWPALMAAAQSGEDFEMTPGEQIRDYLPVEEVAQQFLSWSTTEPVLKGFPAVKNVGSGKPVSMREFAEHWWEKAEAKGSLKVGALPYRENEVMRFVPQI